MPAASVSSSVGQRRSGEAAASSASYSGSAAGTRGSGASRMITIVRTLGIRSRIPSRIGQRLASAKMTESAAWLMMKARSCGARRRLSVWSTAPEQGAAQ